MFSKVYNKRTVLLYINVPILLQSQVSNESVTENYRTSPDRLKTFR